MNSVGRLLLSCLALSSCNDAAQSPPQTVGTYDAQTQTAINALFADYNRTDAPGCALGVFRHAGESRILHYGMADLAHNVPISQDSIFGVASLSKQFTAMSVLLAAEEGRLSLDEDIHAYIPELPDYGARITLRQLLTHTAGMAEYERLYQDRSLDYDTADRAKQIEAVSSDAELVSPPGTAFSYTNTDYLLAGIAVERASGQSMREFADENIFGPLGMRNTAYVSDPAEIASEKAVSYGVEDKGQYRGAVFGAHAGPTGVQTTITDLGLWAENFYTGKVGGRRLVTELQTPGFLSDGTQLDYGFGLKVGKLGPYEAVYHDGATLGTRAALARFPHYQTTIALLCNRDRLNPLRLVAQVAAIIFE